MNDGSVNRATLQGRLLLACAVLLSLPVAAAATPISYTEVLTDTLAVAPPDGQRDLTRTRILNGVVTVENDDATIAADHAISPNWGFSTADSITYSHRLTGLPPLASYLSGSLTIQMFGAEPGLTGLPNDFVFVDATFVGLLTPGGPGVELSTTFSTTDNAVMQAFLFDDRIDILIVPLGPFFSPDAMSIHSSTLDLTATAVPEPSTLALLGAGLAVLSQGRRAVGAKASDVGLPTV